MKAVKLKTPIFNAVKWKALLPSLSILHCACLHFILVVSVGDAWLLDVTTHEWRQLRALTSPVTRLWHRACYTPEGDLYVFGGCANDILATQTNSVCFVFKCIIIRLQLWCNFLKN